MDKLHELQSCKVAKLQFTIYIVQLITSQLQLSQHIFNIIQLHYNYTHDVMLMSLIVIHLLNLTHDIMKIFRHKKKFQICFKG